MQPSSKRCPWTLLFRILWGQKHSHIFSFVQRLLWRRCFSTKTFTSRTDTKILDEKWKKTKVFVWISACAYIVAIFTSVCSLYYSILAATIGTWFMAHREYTYYICWIFTRILGKFPPEPLVVPPTKQGQKHSSALTPQYICKWFHLFETGIPPCLKHEPTSPPFLSNVPGRPGGES